jgi:hypothetical protein
MLENEVDSREGSGAPSWRLGGYPGADGISGRGRLTLGPDARLALFWAVLGTLGTAAVLPYLLAINPSRAEHLPLPVPLWGLLYALAMGTNLLFLGWVGFRLGRPLGLGAPVSEALLAGKRPVVSWRGLALAVVTGAAAGAGTIGLAVAFAPLMPPVPPHLRGGVEAWKGLLGCFYGGIVEELLLRLFAMTLLTWLLAKVLGRGRPRPAPLAYAAAVLLAAVLFGVGHLPAAAGVWPLTGAVVARTIALNAFAGVPFGVLYWKRGLEYAMVAHFCADIVLHVLV